MINFLLKSYAGASGYKKRLIRFMLEVVRRFLMLMGDPAYEANIRGKQIILPASHKLPIYVANYPFYDALPTRISDYIRTTRGFLAMVDVGANVGDTILACFDREDDRFLAVEAHPDFIRYLKLNSSKIEHFTLAEVFCHSGINQETGVQIDASGGTARIREGQGLVLPRKTLDEIIDETTAFKDFNFLKIDTDGNDFDILKSARQYLSKSKPIILMECDVFDNRAYGTDFAEAMEYFGQLGYSFVLAYDNLGNLFEIFEVKDFASFKYALFYQLVSQFGYFDLLILKPEDQEFMRSELAYFVEQIANSASKSAASDVLNL